MSALCVLPLAVVAWHTGGLRPCKLLLLSHSSFWGWQIFAVQQFSFWKPAHIQKAGEKLHMLLRWWAMEWGLAALSQSRVALSFILRTREILYLFGNSGASGRWKEYSSKIRRWRSVVSSQKICKSHSVVYSQTLECHVFSNSLSSVPSVTVSPLADSRPLVSATKCHS